MLLALPGHTHEPDSSFCRTQDLRTIIIRKAAPVASVPHVESGPMLQLDVFQQDSRSVG